MFDVTFLESNWTCIFGHGCQGVLTGPTPELVQGCCSYGAHFTDEKDAQRVERAAKRLTADQWQFKAKGQRRRPRSVKKNGEIVTRLVKDACIFLNRPDFHRGPGCALHVHGDRQRRELHPAQARGLLATPPAPRRRGRSTTATSSRASPSGTGATGARAARSSTGGAPRTPRPSSARRASSTRCPRSSSRWSARRSTTNSLAYLDRARRAARGHARSPHPVVRTRA